MKPKVLVIALTLIVGLTSTASATVYVPDDYPTIQQAVNNATAGDTIIVRDGIYYENVIVNLKLILKSENGSANCIIDGLGVDVVTITADNVKIEGFTITNGSRGIFLVGNSSIISNNSISNNGVGIASVIPDGIGVESNNNTIADNGISNNEFGIELYGNNNIILGNDILSNSKGGMGISGDGNTITDNNISNSEYGYGMGLNGNSNTVSWNDVSSNTEGGISIWGDGNTITGNSITSNIWGDGLGLWYSSNNKITENSILSNQNGVELWNSSNNNISCNYIFNNTESGIMLSGGSIGNTIKHNNIIANGKYNSTTGGYEWQFYNDQAQDVIAEYNWWGTDNKSQIESSIKEDTGKVDFDPWLSNPYPGAPIPELTTLVLVALGLLVIAGIVYRK